MNRGVEGERMKTVPVQEAVGMVLCQDLTRIVPGEFKGRAFKKGHVVKKSDIEALLEMGRQISMSGKLKRGFLHENEAARRIAIAASGPGIRLTEPCEGRINLIADRTGLLKINVPALHRINAIDQMVFGTVHTGQQVMKRRAVAGTRVVPLVIEQEKNWTGGRDLPAGVSSGWSKTFYCPSYRYGHHRQWKFTVDA